MSELSSAAQAVRDAAEKQTDLDLRYAPKIAAAALRAAANNLRSEMINARRSLFVSGVLASAEALEEIAEQLQSF